MHAVRNILDDETSLVRQLFSKTSPANLKSTINSETCGEPVWQFYSKTSSANLTSTINGETCGEPVWQFYSKTSPTSVTLLMSKLFLQV